MSNKIRPPPSTVVGAPEALVGTDLRNRSAEERKPTSWVLLREEVGLGANMWLERSNVLTCGGRYRVSQDSPT